MSLAEELIDPREPEVINALVEKNLKTTWWDGKATRRGQHAKNHGCVDGVFTVVQDLPNEFSHGVFASGKSYDCVARFSNGGQQDDSKTDVRGLAIKLRGVEGLKLLPGQGDVDEQDFILVDHPTYFTSTMDEYVAFNRHFTPVQDLGGNGFSVGRAIRAAIGLGALLLFHRGLLKAARAFANRRVGSPLALTYHSTTPYLLGPNTAVKYKAIGAARIGTPIETKDGLGDALWSNLAESSQRFDFGVVVQKDEIAHPIEDPSVDWEKNGAVFVKLAELTLPQQENSVEKNELSSHLKFNPWMSLPAQKPLGGINRARRLVYDAMSCRRQKNHGN